MKFKGTKEKDQGNEEGVEKHFTGSKSFWRGRCQFCPPSVKPQFEMVIE